MTAEPLSLVFTGDSRSGSSPRLRHAELRQPLAHVDDLVEPSPEKIRLPAVPALLRPHRITLQSSERQQGITAEGAEQFASWWPARLANPAKTNTSKPSQTSIITACPDSSRKTRYGRRASLVGPKFSFTVSLSPKVRVYHPGDSTGCTTDNDLSAHPYRGGNIPSFCPGKNKLEKSDHL
jgi:hypothetical protein